LPSVSARAGEGSAARTVLHVEDSEPTRRLVRKILESRPNVSLLSASTGELGLALACERLPDLVLLDLGLPDVDGEEVYRRIRG
jgi:DNA-binding response OmpR family regulator